MTQTEATFVDRAGWPSGPWDDEPDRVEWSDQETGLACLALRHPAWGNWCGYVAVPPGHPWHGQPREVPDVIVHGGLTYAAPCTDDDQPEVEQICCHVSAPGGPDDVWWFGFDCIHGHDLVPFTMGLPPLFHRQIYRDLAFVQLECEVLAAQLAAATDE